MSGEREGFVWSDAWLLQAIVYAAREGPPRLSDVIAHGDAIEHAIFTHAEFSGGVSRLVAAGYTTLKAGKLLPTSSGSALVASASPEAPVLEVQAAVGRALSARTHPAQAPPELNPIVPARMFEEAVAAYHARFSAAPEGGT